MWWWIKAFAEVQGGEALTIINNKAPATMTRAAVKAVHGGATSLPSALTRTLQKHRFGVKVLYDPNGGPAGNPPPGELQRALKALDEAELAAIRKAGIEVDTTVDLGSVEAFKRIVTADPNKYHMFLINKGSHWVGATSTRYFNSGCHGPRDGVESQMAGASGWMLEVSKPEELSSTHPGVTQFDQIPGKVYSSGAAQFWANGTE